MQTSKFGLHRNTQACSCVVSLKLNSTCIVDLQAASLRAMYNETRQQGFGAEMKRRILMGTYALSAGYYDAYYKQAQQVR